MEESSESGSGHSNRLVGLRRVKKLVNVVSRGQGPKQRFSWREAKALEMAPGREELTVSCVVCRVLGLVSSLSFRKERKRGAGRVNGNSLGKVQTLTKDWPSQAYEGDELEFLTSANWSSGKRLEGFAALGTYRAGLIGVHHWDEGTNILLGLRGELQG